MMEQARRRAEGGGIKNIRFRQGDVGTPPYDTAERLHIKRGDREAGK